MGRLLSHIGVLTNGKRINNSQFLATLLLKLKNRVKVINLPFFEKDYEQDKNNSSIINGGANIIATFILSWKIIMNFALVPPNTG
jgi:hypothetical protein